MPSRRPDFAPGHYYHFYNRGAHRVSLFREKENYVLVLRRMKEYCQTLHLSPIAYCLLPNHYHWLVRQDGEHRAGALPQLVFNSYVKAHNNRYDHSGTLFEGNYRAKPVEAEVYLLHLCRYIHANPVIHSIVEHVDDWPYSNYPEWVGDRAGSLVDRQFVQDHFPRAADYRKFVAEYIAERRLPEELADYIREWEA